jgi:peptidoglycan/LPS O-acetylase OafA/YrhL
VTAKSEIKAMTGLRGIAAMMVTVYHVNPELATRARAGIGAVIGKGYLWVDLFFALSGFVLALNYAQRFAAGWSWQSWIDFLIRRVARVYPLYLTLVLAAAAIILAGHGEAVSLPALTDPKLHHPVTLGFANLLMIQSWGFGISFDGTAWSLSAEWAAYLLFPALVALALFSRKPVAIAIAAGAASAIAVTALLTASDGEAHSGPLDAYDGTSVEPLLRCLGGFVLGVLAFRLARAEHRLRWLAHDATIAVIVALLIAGFAADLYDLAILPLFPLLIVGLYRNRGRLGRAFGCGALHRLGVVSYSLYLVHPFFVAPKAGLESWSRGFLPPRAADLLASLAIYLALLLVSSIAYRVIEEPGRRSVNRLANAWSARQRGKPEGAASVQQPAG